MIITTIAISGLLLVSLACGLAVVRFASLAARAGSLAAVAIANGASLAFICITGLLLLIALAGCSPAQQQQAIARVKVACQVDQ